MLLYFAHNTVIQQKLNFSFFLQWNQKLQLEFSIGHLTSDKHIGRVGVKARFGVDAQGVHAFIFLVEVDKGECGAFPRPVGVNPFRGLQGDS